MYLSDRQRIEIALPSCLMLGVLIASDDKQNDALGRALDWLKIAAREPVEDLAPERAARVLERLRKLHRELIRAQAPGEPFDLTVLYWVESLLDCGYFVLSAGSAIDQALGFYRSFIGTISFPPAAHRSAQEEANALLARLQRRGYYEGACPRLDEVAS